MTEMTDDLASLLPHDIAVERATLGAMLNSKAAIGEATGILAAEDFFRPAHQMTFKAIVDLYGDGAPIERTSVISELARREELHVVGGWLYVHELADAAGAGTLGYYARQVAALAIRRRVAEGAMRVADWVRSPGIPTDELVTAAQEVMFTAAGHRGNAGMARIGDLVEAVALDSQAAADGVLEAHGLPTGIVDLDDAIGGLRPGQVWIVAGRPGAGKSIFGLDVARQITLRYGAPAALFTMEMSRHEVAQRYMAAQARVALTKIRKGTMSAEDWGRFTQALPAAADAPLWIDDTAAISVPEIRAKVMRINARGGPRVVIIIIDYLQLLSMAGKTENRQQEVSAISRALRILAKDLGVVVLALSQLNRESERRGDKRPQISDLRESGTLEQDAFGVILLFRPDLGEVESARAGEIDLIIAKNRSGVTGTVTAAFQGHYGRMVDMAS